MCAKDLPLAWILRKRTAKDDLYDKTQKTLLEAQKNYSDQLLLTIIAFSILGVVIVAGIIYACYESYKKKRDEAPNRGTITVLKSSGIAMTDVQTIQPNKGAPKTVDKN
jgi:hypothetical protein